MIARTTVAATMGAMLAVGALALSGAAATGTAFAMGEAPKPVVDCRKKKNKDKPECKNQARPDTATGPRMTDDQIYAAAYVLAEEGQYGKARDLLATAHNQDDPRILNYLGFTTRKLGDARAALVYYQRALELRPDYALARSYMGEALIALGDADGARAQLAEIERICSRACEPYTKLAKALDGAS